ncbi:2OG-Fe(II) oxygenase [Nocardia sp. CDC159]|uniref:2OG-Fe(II) oxygenase n=1 Tax=Nocardia pulmonis TaxID=2951408 RepID=A0A9X2IZ27_9NOCA|nr:MULTISPECIES: 2OG-Fe(II) oxygenase [Nocardia]MCM6774506.1 2OG-Fe(II) oxygenase [Nocardia pulmonis]MCM6787428.1 2OG-Fe(II) oxygenase [Nocardia sp. CDC159]
MRTPSPIGLGETLALGSIEGFLDHTETHELTTVMEQHLTGIDRAETEHRRATSIHEIPGRTPRETMSIYEPAGRLEIADIPTAAEKILQIAFDRARPTIARLLPSVTSCRPWTYVEYGPGQHITPHLDGIAPDPRRWPRQIAGIGVSITNDYAGGEFFVETTSDDRLWNCALPSDIPGYAPTMAFAHDGADNSSPWFTSMARTRWTTSTTTCGTALLYGSQLTHGTRPVTRGRARKFISWLFTD